VVLLVEALRVSLAHLLEELRNTRTALRRDQQMDVVRHQDVRMHLTAVLATELRQEVHIEVSIDIVDKAGAAVITAMDHVVRISVHAEAGVAWHERFL
jgi:hypothetical protein